MTRPRFLLSLLFALACGGASSEATNVHPVVISGGSTDEPAAREGTGHEPPTGEPAPSADGTEMHVDGENEPEHMPANVNPPDRHPAPTSPSSAMNLALAIEPLQSPSDFDGAVRSAFQRRLGALQRCLGRAPYVPTVQQHQVSLTIDSRGVVISAVVGDASFGAACLRVSARRLRWNPAPTGNLQYRATITVQHLAP